MKTENGADYEIGDRNRVRQVREAARYDRATVHAILDAGLSAHVAFCEQGRPVIVPMIYARDGETLYLHGARKARIVRLLEGGAEATLNVTLIDGIVAARSAFNSSVNYRSVTVFGRPWLVADEAEKIEAMRLISEHLMPGRWDELRPPHDREVKMTGVIALPIESASAKVTAGPPEDEDEDYALPVWAGVVPVEQVLGAPEADPELAPDTPVSPALLRLARSRRDRRR
ncbi:pyridoxamine 5'-phosphate oxidase family protein [Lentisalinibacter orientalis]|jgi:nitroimidazol reductase NimA-like FMN-containing flavoprotein (pyridoxamine 5'-phosphate oxidase superfamily)|uniref:pyridoxamine 5'-phosphate oxidase family protein n=1 Tax=Lentisalinibacter orientalis TaxID=2992241 RepID=UPI00386FE61C